MKRIAYFLGVLAVLALPGTGEAQLGGVTPPPPPPLPGVCVGPLCVPPPEHVITQVAPAIPVIPSDPLGPTPPPPIPPTPPPGCTNATLDMRVLVLAADGNEPSLAAAREALDHHSVPHEVWIATQRPGQLTSAALASGTCDGNYQGVILATGSLAYSPDGGVTWLSALTADEWLALRTYEARFDVREISWYVFPGADQGLNAPTAGFDAGAAGFSATLTADGRSIFPAVNAANPIPVRHAWTYLTTPADPAVKTLLVDAAGNALMSMRTTADGRETLAMTFDSSPWVFHDVVLAHGLVEWLTRGIYVGEYRVYLTPQVDDLYLDNDMYFGGTYRMTAHDVSTMQLWQSAFQLTTGNPDFRLAFAFNAFGSTPDDPLTLAISVVQGNYHFINHTFEHINMDAMSYTLAYNEVRRNDQFAKAQGFTRYVTANLVTPQVSGLKNANAMRGAADAGIRYTVSDTSQPGWNNPRPNIGIRSTLEPRILHLPRRPTNLFVNVASPAEWVAEYNAFYRSYWGRDLSYPEILDKESEFLLFYMVRGDIDSQMYHQANLKAYDGVRSLLSDLLDAAWAKYSRHYKLPVSSPDMDVGAKRMTETMVRNESGLEATLTTSGVTFTSPVTVRFPVSGVCNSSSERYAGKCITSVRVPANGRVTIAF
jgi:hypothetical protein